MQRAFPALTIEINANHSNLRSVILPATYQNHRVPAHNYDQFPAPEMGDPWADAELVWSFCLSFNSRSFLFLSSGVILRTCKTSSAIFSACAGRAECSITMGASCE